MRALALWAHMQVDISHRHTDAKIRQNANDMAALMTPIIKAAGTDCGSEISNLCLQVFGGHGYIREHGMEQIVRDVRITQIYEGTNTIQAIDLVTRKLSIENGRLFNGWLADVDTLVKRLAGRNDMAEFVVPFKESVARLKATTQWLAEQSKTDDNARGAAAVDYLRLFALSAFAWVWVMMVEKALEKREDGNSFYEMKLNLARYFMARVLPQSRGLDAIIRAGSVTAMTPAEADF